jgi:hypothetical protein
MKLTTTIKKPMFFNSTIYGLLRANLKRIEESSAGPKPNSQSNKSVERVPVPIKQRDSRSYAMVVQAVLVGETTGGGFETLGGDKTHCFITRTQAYNYLTQKLNTIHALSLSLSLVFLSTLSTQWCS